MTGLAIDEAEMLFHPLSGCDDVGRLFEWKGRFFRGIVSSRAEAVRDFFACGLASELTSAGLIPECRISEFVSPQFSLIVEHEKIHPIVYPHEWSFLMLRDAALTVLDVQAVALRFGYQLKDCHGYNIVFSGPRPLYVDLGSFFKPVSKQGFYAYEEFVKSYEYPLRLWASGSPYIARAVLSRAVIESISHRDFAGNRYLWTGAWLRDLFVLIVELRHRYLRIPFLEDAYLGQAAPGFIARLLVWMKRRRLLPGQRIDLDKLRRRINRLTFRGFSTPWRDYYAKGQGEAWTPRFDRVCRILESLNIKSLCDLGGNEGVLSRETANRRICSEIICVDRDEGAVDKAYRYAKQNKLMIFFASADFVFPGNVIPEEPPWERFRSEAVTALAVTHHLVLSQKIPLSKVFETFSRYASRYVVTEFMPLGLHDGRRAPPVPEGYTREWFRGEFVRHFSLLAEEVLEPNRILFVGEKK
jgi:hypothetical protein